MTTEDTPSRRRPADRRRRIWLVAGLVVVAALIVSGAVYWSFLATPPAPGGPSGGVVLQASGSGDEVTDSFFVRDGWQIHWESEGPRFAFAIRGDIEFGRIVERDGAASGITSPVPSGNFYLEVTANGPWTITIYQGD